MPRTAPCADPAFAAGTASANSSRLERLQAALYAAALVWVNAYICRDLFSASTTYMNSMHGFWTALAKMGDGSWLHPAWWPYWDCGIPFEYTYAPLVPGMAAVWAAFRGISHSVAVHSVAGFFYCLGPLTLFLMAWRLTRAPGYSFAAALFYSLTSPTQIVTPDGEFALTKLWDARRLFLLSTWDDTPHYAALALLPLVILFLARAIETRRPAYHAAAVIAIALMALASAFGPVIVAMASVCLLFVLRRQDYRSNIAVTAAIGVYAWALAAVFLSPTLLRVIHESSAASDEEGWTAGSLTALAIAVVGWAILWQFLRRSKDWQLQFFALFAWITSSLPLIATYLHRHFIPQPNRYKFEMEMALAVALVFGARRWFETLPVSVRRALVLLLLAIASEQIVSYRRFEKKILSPRHITDTVEYRAATWAGRNLDGVRVFLPGSVAMWADAFAPVSQFAGGAFSMAYNQVQQNANAAIVFGGGTALEDARLSVTWLKAFGVGAVGISGPNSQEYWKPFSHPAKFDGMLPVLWSEGGVTIYQVTGPAASLAHVVPVTAIVRHSPKTPEDVPEVEQFVGALENPAMPPTRFEWLDRNHIRILAPVSRGQALSVQVSYHPGWKAFVAGRQLEVRKDGLGLMWLRPECSGSCEIQLRYDGGWELRFCRYLSCAALLFLVPVTLWAGRAARRPQASAGDAAQPEAPGSRA